MSYLDTPSVPDPSTVSNRDLALRYGAIWAGAGILVTLLGFLTNTDAGLPSTPGWIKAIYSIISLGVAVWAVVMGVKEDRDKNLGGFISLGRCVGLGTLMGLVSGIISMVFFLLYTSVINPGYSQQLTESITAAQQAQGLSEEQIEMSAKFTSFFTNPIFLGLTQIMGGIVFGVILGLVAGVILKKEKI
jgi:Na+/H+-dicarboxylate symporter